MPTISRISSAFSEPWVAWLMFLLLLFFLMAEVLLHSIVNSSFRAVKINREHSRLFDDQQYSITGEICLFLYKLLVFALAVYVAVCGQYISYSFVDYAIVVGVCLAVYLISLLIEQVVVRIFLSKGEMQIIFMQQRAISNLLSLTFYPVLLLFFFTTFITPVAVLIPFITLVSAASVLWLYKAFQFFFNSVLAGVYIFLYLCTLKLLPLAICLYLVSNLIT